MLTPLNARVIEMKRRGFHSSRWFIVAGVPLFLLVMLVLSMQNWPVAQAAGDFVVGTCLGVGEQTHTTIQAAVNAASPGTVIDICPKSYDESVNLSLMNTVGDITLRRAPGQSGAVLIASTSGDSIAISPTNIFSGNITLQSLQLSSLVGDGINFANSGGSVQGTVVLSDVESFNNAGFGAIVNTNADAFITNSNFHDNGLIGILINGSQTVEISNTKAISNGASGGAGVSGSGIQIEAADFLLCDINSAATAYHVTLDNVTASENHGWGINIHSGYDTSIGSTDVISNAYDGINVSAFACVNEPNIDVSGSLAQFNGWYSTIQSTGEIDIASAEEYGGIRLNGGSSITVQGATEASANQGFGFCVYGGADTNIHDAVANNNVDEGYLYSEACDYVNRDSVSTEQAKDGDGEPKVIIDSPVADFSAMVSDSSAISNGGIGFAFTDPYANIQVSRISATGNVTGVAFSAPETIYGVKDISGDNLDTQVIASPGSTAITDSLIEGNSSHGVYYGQPSYSIGSLSPAPVITTTNLLNGNIICENGTGLEAAQFVPIGPFSTGAIGAQGGANGYTLYVDARGNWWGDASGPKATGNVGGQGDSIVSTEDNAPTDTVVVAYEPWIDTIFASASPNPTIVNVPVDVAYQFANSGLSYFLQNGVGNPHEGPLFTLSTNNGSIVGDTQKFIVNKFIVGSAKPTTAGTMQVTLSGPCGLDSTQNVLVAAPGIHVEKTPDLQGVAPGASADFTVTVSNAGNITLTNVVVTDPIATNCARSSGALGDLGIGDSSTYACSLNNVQNNFINTVTASGFALVDGSPAGNAVSDSDTAEVMVASFTLTKTVFVDGFKEKISDGFNPSNCALNSAITVPAGTTVKYCYTITNTGDYTLTTHTLVDDHFSSAILDDFPRVVGPGQSFSTVDAGVQVTKTLTVSTTNVATWTAEIAAPVVNLGTEAVNVSIPVVVNAQAVVNMSSSAQDQDGDGITDITEGSGDANNNGIPDFLDPAGPTDAPPTDQPDRPGQGGRLFLPSLGNND